MWCDYYKKNSAHGIKTKPGSVVGSQADPHSWILQKDRMSLNDEWDPFTISNSGDLPD